VEVGCAYHRAPVGEMGFVLRLATLQLVAGLMTTLGALALVLSMEGRCEVIGSVVSGRRQETGIRMAFGARPADILGRWGDRGRILSGVSVAIGPAGAFAVGRLSSRSPRASCGLMTCCGRRGESSGAEPVLPI
jgi:hypothetical protein